MDVLRRHLERYGRPVALYSDRHRIFRINPVEPANGATTTQFGRVLAGLEIEAIHARTPQATGRVERANQTLQDRLVKALRRRGLSDLESANADLPAFIADCNPRFAVTASAVGDAHRPLAHTPRALDLLLAEQEERTLSKNLTLQYRNIAYQIRYDGPGYRLRGAKVTVCALANGEVVLLREGRELPDTSYRKGERPPPPAEDEKTLNARVDAALEKQQRQRDKPARDHPWRQAGAMAAARTAT